MAISIKHTFQSAKSDGADTTLVQPSNWNAEHTITAAAGKVLGRDTSGAGVVQELPIAVDAAGNVGIGTTAPSCALDVVRSAANSVVNITSGSNTLQLFENTAGDASLINYASGKSITVSQAGAGFINFGTNSTERVRIDSSGRVGIGTSSPGGKIHTQLATSFSWGGSWDAGAAVFGGSSAGSGGLGISYNDTDGAVIGSIIPGVDWKNLKFLAYSFEFGASGGAVATRINNNGAIDSPPTYNNTAVGSTVVVTSTGAIRRTSSSIKYKKDVESLDPALATNAIDNLRPVYYRTKNAEGDDKASWSHIGLIAEEVHEVEPRLVRYRTAEVIEEQKPVLDENGDPALDDEGNPITTIERAIIELEVPEPEDVDYARLSVLLLAEVQSLRARVAALEAA